MFPKLKTSVLQHLHPFVLLGLSLSLIVGLTAFGGVWYHEYELRHDVKVTSATVRMPHLAPAAVNGSATTEQSKTQVTGDNTGTPGAAVSPQPNDSHQNSPSSGNTTSPVPATAPATQPASVAVSLNINSAYKGEVTLPAGSTQCEVLQQALAEGVISSLDMRYSTQYKTYAVYVIEGQGDSAAIWWTYTVNGKSPPYGCSGTKVVSGDSVNWNYVKK